MNATITFYSINTAIPGGEEFYKFIRDEMKGVGVGVETGIPCNALFNSIISFFVNPAPASATICSNVVIYFSTFLIRYFTLQNPATIFPSGKLHSPKSHWREESVKPYEKKICPLGIVQITGEFVLGCVRKLRSDDSVSTTNSPKTSG